MKKVYIVRILHVFEAFDPTLMIVNSSDILALCETNSDDSTGSGNFSVRDNLPLIQKNSITQMHGFEVYVKEGLPFARDLSLENSADFY